MRPVAIVGGGISGLAAAYFLGRAEIPTRLFECRSRLGGIIRTDTLASCRVEAGPDSWLAEKTWMLDLVRELGLGHQVIGSNDARRRTYIVRDGRTVPLPDSMRLLAPAKPWQALTTPLFSPATKVRMALEWFRRPSRQPDRSVAAFVRDHFGSEAVDYLAQPLLSGVYGSPPEALSAQSVIPRFVEYERRYGSILRGTFANRHVKSRLPMFQTLRGGMGVLIDALLSRVEGSCEVVRDRVLGLGRDSEGWSLHLRGGSCAADTVVLAVPAFEAGRLTSSVAPRLARLLAGIEYTSSVVAALIYPRPGFGHALDGFGLLVPRAEQGDVAACTWASTKFAGRSPGDRALLRAFITGSGAERAMAASDGAILRRTDAELRKHMGFQADPIAGAAFRLAKAMPRYGVGHGERQTEIERQLRRLPGLHLTGNGYDGLGIPDCVRRSERVAAAIATGTAVPRSADRPVRPSAGRP